MCIQSREHPDKSNKYYALPEPEVGALSYRFPRRSSIVYTEMTEEQVRWVFYDNLK